MRQHNLKTRVYVMPDRFTGEKGDIWRFEEETATTPMGGRVLNTALAIGAGLLVCWLAVTLSHEIGHVVFALMRRAR